MAWQFYDQYGSIKRATVSDLQTLGGVASGEFVQHYVLEEELSYKADFDHGHDYLYGSSILSAVQSSIVTDASGTFQDLPGVSLTLPTGKWAISVNGNPRGWQSGTSYTNHYNQMRITNSDASVVHASAQTSTTTQAEQAAPASLSLAVVLQIAVAQVVKVQGAHSIITGGANFAGGWRWDSGYGLPCSMYAVRIGA